MRLFSLAILSITIILFSVSCSHVRTAKQYLGSMKRYHLSQIIEERHSNNLCLISDECTVVYGGLLTNKASTYVALVSTKNSKSREFLTASILSPSVDSSDFNYNYILYLPKGKFDVDIIETDEKLKFTHVLTKQSQYVDIDSKKIDGNDKEIQIVETIHDKYRRDDLNRHQRELESKLLLKDISSIVHSQKIIDYSKIYKANDVVFQDKMIAYGMYNISQFTRRADYIYAFDKRDNRKIPVLFVHGTMGSPRNFTKLINELDRSKYVPYALYYPTGESLKFEADIFAKVFFSSYFTQDEPLIIVAHSNGGVMVREAFNKKDQFFSNTKYLFISIASPFGGLNGANGATNAPYVIPYWKDIASKSNFIKNLYRKPLTNTEYEMIISYKGHIDLSADNSDGTVTLESQFREESQEEAISIRGYNETHASILESNIVKKRVDFLMDKFYTKVKTK